MACEDCRKKQYSLAEKEIVEYIRNMGFNVQENAHLTGDNTSYDIYIPEKEVAFDYNGLYWHSTKIRPTTVGHRDRILNCAKTSNNIRLYYIWEDDYRDRKELVLSFINEKLGVSDKENLNSNECFVTIEKSNSIELQDFIKNNDIKGFLSGSINLALRENNTREIVSAMIVNPLKSVNGLKIFRYCYSKIIYKGFEKLVDFLETYYNKDFIIINSDNDVSNGELYEETGFKPEKLIDPDYYYIVNNSRVHKFKYRKSYFKKTKGLIYKEGLTERELAELNGILRIYDSGKIQWIKYSNI